MRIRNFVLVSLATLGSILAQEHSAPQETKPKPDYFTQPQFRPLRPFVQQDGLAPKEGPLAKPKPDFKLPLVGSLRRPLSKNRLVRLTLKQNLLSENPPPCSIPLLEAQIPKDIDFKIRQFHPSPDQLGPMATVKAPAPACDDKK
jgi:hypothetical protein